MFEGCLYIFFCQFLTDIKASLHRPRISFLTDQLAFLIVLVFVQTLRSTDGQVTVIQLYRDLVFRKARKIDIHFIMVFMFMHIRLHQTIRMSAVQLSFRFVQIGKIREIKPVVKQIFSENTRHQHNQFLLLLNRLYKLHEQWDGGFGPVKPFCFPDLLRSFVLTML